jgi:hypothetical protein
MIPDERHSGIGSCEGSRQNNLSQAIGIDNWRAEFTGNRVPHEAHRGGRTGPVPGEGVPDGAA